jgi:hypothetical protein
MFARLLLIAAVSLTSFGTPSASYAAGALMKYCKADAERLCPGVEPGGGRILKCLKSHKEEMTVGCAEALQKLKSEMGK